MWQCASFWQVQVKIHGLFHLLSRVAWLHHSKNSYGKPKFEATDYAFIWREFFCFKDIHGLFTISIGLSLSFFWEWSLWPVPLLVDVRRSPWAMVRNGRFNPGTWMNMARICIEVLSYRHWFLNEQKETITSMKHQGNPNRNVSDFPGIVCQYVQYLECFRMSMAGCFCKTMSSSVKGAQ